MTSSLRITFYLQKKSKEDLDKMCEILSEKLIDEFKNCNQPEAWKSLGKFIEKKEDDKCAYNMYSNFEGPSVRLEDMKLYLEKVGNVSEKSNLCYGYDIKDISTVKYE